VTLLVFTVASGTIGFELIEGWGFMDALYMTVITMATVGYQEIRPLGEAGRIFNMILIFLGLGTTTYVAASVVRFMVEGRIRAIMGRRRLDRKIDRLKNHYLICGYGRIGRILCQTLLQKPVDLVVIEKSPDLIPVMEADRVLFLQGEATSEEILQRAGIERARCLVAVLGTDTDNVFLVLTARQLAPQLMIIALFRRSQRYSNGRTGRERRLPVGASEFKGFGHPPEVQPHHHRHQKHRWRHAFQPILRSHHPARGYGHRRRRGREPGPAGAGLMPMTPKKSAPAG